MLCEVSGCTNPVLAKGLCGKHYERKRKHGSVHACKYKKAPKGAPRKFLEALSLHGSGCVTWPFATNNRGYGQVKLTGGKGILAHRISCERKNGPPPSEDHVAAHTCGKGHLGCVAPWHLEWKTPVENMADMVRHGTRHVGEDSAVAKMTESDVTFVHENTGKLSQQEMAEIIGVSQTAVSHVVLGKTWSHSSPQTKFRVSSRKRPKSGMHGVTRLPSGRWQAKINKTGKTKTIGVFDCPLRASLSYQMEKIAKEVRNAS